MSESTEPAAIVDLHFNVAVAGKARRGQDVFGVERTPYVDGLLEHGIASLIGGAVDALCAETSDTSTDGPADPPAADDTQTTFPQNPGPRDHEAELAAAAEATLPIGSSRRKAADAALRAAVAQDTPNATDTPAEPGGVQEPPPEVV